MKKTRSLLLMLFIVVVLGATGCSEMASSLDSKETTDQVEESSTKEVEPVNQKEAAVETPEKVSSKAKDQVDGEDSDSKISSQMVPAKQELGHIPEYSGKAYIAINNNVPFFSQQDMSNTSSFERYSDLDEENRCGVAYANIGIDIMPTSERGTIGSVKPTGWHTIKYDNISGKYLYNRCHLIGFQLAGENANEKNLITGTRYLNIDGMLPFENMVTDYVKETNHHVLYRVTPIFQELNLLASGVLMEGYSVEDNGEGIEFCVYAYDVQPGIKITYATGDSASEGGATATAVPEKAATPVVQPTESQAKTDVAVETAKEPVSVTQPKEATSPDKEVTYIINKNTKKFHIPGCASVSRMNEENKIYSTKTREELIAEGCEPCKNCNP